MVATVATSQRRILLSADDVPQLITYQVIRGASQQGSCKLVDSRGYTYGVEDCFQEVTSSHVVMMLPFAPNHTDVSRRLVKMLLMEEERINKNEQQENPAKDKYCIGEAACCHDAAICSQSQ